MPLWAAGLVIFLIAIGFFILLFQSEKIKRKWRIAIAGVFVTISIAVLIYIALTLLFVNSIDS